MAKSKRFCKVTLDGKVMQAELLRRGAKKTRVAVDGSLVTDALRQYEDEGTFVVPTSAVEEIGASEEAAPVAETPAVESPAAVAEPAKTEVAAPEAAATEQQG